MDSANFRDRVVQSVENLFLRGPICFWDRLCGMVRIRPVHFRYHFSGPKAATKDRRTGPHTAPLVAPSHLFRLPLHFRRGRADFTQSVNAERLNRTYPAWPLPLTSPCDGPHYGILRGAAPLALCWEPRRVGRDMRVGLLFRTHHICSTERGTSWRNHPDVSERRYR